MDNGIAPCEALSRFVTVVLRQPRECETPENRQAVFDSSISLGAKNSWKTLRAFGRGGVCLCATLDF
jgi:hypothetical protein